MSQPKRHIACSLCRQRKLRCDGQRPACTTCVRSQTICEYADTVRKAGPKRGYIRTLESRVLELEGLLNKHNIPTQQQQQQQQHHNHNHPAPSPSSPRTSPGSTGFTVPKSGIELDEEMPPSEVVNELTELFFQRFNVVIPCIDRAKYMAALAQPDLAAQPKPYLQYAVMTTAACDFAKYQALKHMLYERARRYTTRFENSRVAGVPSLAYIQTLCLLAHIETKEGLFHLSFQEVGKAYRAASIMLLHTLDRESWQTPCTRENPELTEFRRAFWLIFIIDRFGSVATALPAVVDVNDVFVKMPMDDDAFLAGSADSDCVRMEDVQRTPELLSKFPLARLAMLALVAEMAYQIVELGIFPHKRHFGPESWAHEYTRADELLLRLIENLPPIPSLASGEAQSAQSVNNRFRRGGYVLVHVLAKMSLSLVCRAGFYGIQHHPVLLPLINPSKLLQRALVGILEVLFISRNPHDLTMFKPHPLHIICLAAACVFLLLLSEYDLVLIENFKAPVQYIIDTLVQLGPTLPLCRILCSFIVQFKLRLMHNATVTRSVEEVISSTVLNISLPNIFRLSLDTGEGRLAAKLSTEGKQSRGVLAAEYELESSPVKSEAGSPNGQVHSSPPIASQVRTSPNQVNHGLSRSGNLSGPNQLSRSGNLSSPKQLSQSGNLSSPNQNQTIGNLSSPNQNQTRGNLSSPNQNQTRGSLNQTSGHSPNHSPQNMLHPMLYTNPIQKHTRRPSHPIQSHEQLAENQPLELGFLPELAEPDFGDMAYQRMDQDPPECFPSVEYSWF